MIVTKVTYDRCGDDGRHLSSWWRDCVTEGNCQQRAGATRRIAGFGDSAQHGGMTVFDCVDIFLVVCTAPRALTES